MTAEEIRSMAAGMVREERDRQDAKWGEQNHGPVAWIAIHTEELGEAAREAMHAEGMEDDKPGAWDRYVKETVQLAATAQAAVECVLRNNIFGDEEPTT